MFSRDDVIWGMVLPAAWTVVMLLVSSLPWRKGRGRATAPWGMALAIGGAFAMAYSGIAGRPAFPPIEAEGWLVYLALVAGIIGIIATMMRRWGWIGAVLSAAALAATAWMILRPPGGASWVIMAIVAAAMISWWAGMELLARQVRGPALPVLLAIFSVAAAMVLMNSATQTYAKMAGAVVIVLVVAIALAWFVQIDLAGGGVLAVAIVILGLLVAGKAYAEVTWTDALLLALAPLAAWSGMLPAVRQRKWVAVFVAAIAVAIVLSVVMAPTIVGLAHTYHEQMESTAE